jgi:hypothetical protein
MSGFYNRATATAMRLLEKFGRSWSISSTDDAGTVTRHDAMGAFIETVRHELGNSGVAIGDRKYIMTADAAPKNGDRMTDGSSSFVIVWSDAIGDTPAAYWIWGRSG